MIKKALSSHCNRRIKYSLFAFLLSSGPFTAVVMAEPVTDLRVIIDISGSMKKTDPQNLRRPAVRLLAGMIPAGSRSGMWNFGKQVNMSVKIGNVNDAWREEARKQSQEINSVGLYTNIEDAIRKASFDWKNPDPGYKRNLILLTDGHVDIGKDVAANKASKSRIIKDILPALEKAKVRIHTIALSDDVDDELLSTLATYTNGLYKKVSSAEGLQKVFLQMLEQSAALDSLPLQDNQFNVDASINDMTLLVFNKNKSQPTKIVTPEKQTWSAHENSKEVKWFSDQGFDLITIKKPQQGKWKIIAPLDSNNRVVVATNLKLKINELPGYALVGDVIDVTAQLTEDSKAVADQRLLSKFIFSIERKIDSLGEWKYEMSPSDPDDNKRYYQIPSVSKEGVNELVIKAESATAEREIHHQYMVYASPADIAIAERNGKFELRVTPHENILRTDSVRIDIEFEDKNTDLLTQQDNYWYSNIDNKYHGTMLKLNINAMRADGKPVTMSFNKLIETQSGRHPLSLEEKPPVFNDHNKDDHSATDTLAKADELKSQGGHSKDEEAPEKDEHKKTGNSKEKEGGVKEDINWTLIIISIVIGNILLLSSFLGGYLLIKRRKQKLSESLKVEMAEEK